MQPTSPDAKPSAHLPAREAAARGSALRGAQHGLARLPPPPEFLLDALVRVATATRDDALFARARPLLPPMPAPAPHPPAVDAWSRGDAHHAIGDMAQARFWWSAALRFGDTTPAEADGLMARIDDANESPVLRARAAMRLVVATEARRKTFFFSAGAAGMLGAILQWEPDYLPAQILRAAQTFAQHDQPLADEQMRRLWPVAVAAGLSPAAPPPVPASRAERLWAWQALAAFWPEPVLPSYAQAVALFESGDGPAAERQASELAAREPLVPAPHELLAQIYALDHRWPKARAAWQSSLLRDACRADAWLGLATSELMLGELEAAHHSVRQCADNSQERLARQWLEVGYGLALPPGPANEPAIDAFRAALAADDRTDEDEFNALINLGVTMGAAGRTLEASIALTQARELVPDQMQHVTALDLPLARSCHEAGRFEDAVRAYDRYLAQHEGDEDAFWERLQALVEGGQAERARQQLDQVAARAPSDQNTRRRLGEGYLSVQAFVSARRWLEPLYRQAGSIDSLLLLMQALQADNQAEAAVVLADQHADGGRPLAPRVFEAWANALMHIKQPERALAICERGRAAFPDSASLAFCAAMVLGARGDMQASVPLVYETLRLDPDHVDGLRLIARLPADDERPRHKLECLARLFDLAPRDLGLAMQLAMEADRAGDENLSLRACERAAQSEQFGAMALHLTGCIVRRQGDLSGACDVFEEALAIDPDEESLWQELAETRAALEQWDAAEACWRRALELDADDQDVRAHLARLEHYRRHSRRSPSPTPPSTASATEGHQERE